ncbi:MAG: hypothetical protein HOH89_04275 [Alphaproteobacteria bacterium]|nr:hypothetical protein [Alphaproteobacteria bacterium]
MCSGGNVDAQAFRAALDGANSNVDPANLDDVSEGMRGTSGAYRKVWQ